MATRGVNEQVLDRDKQRVIRLQAALVREGKFFLAGGTALGLRIGHRFSDDLDWFTPNRFDANELLARLGHLTEKPTKTKQDGRHTVRAYYGTLETSFISYEQVPAHPEQISVSGTKIPVADIDILAAMKAAALHDRGAKRDFVDVHAIAGLSGWSVGRFIEHGARMLPLDAEQVALALTYFVDAEKQAMPRGYKVPWDDVKNDLIEGVRDWERARKRGAKR